MACSILALRYVYLKTTMSSLDFWTKSASPYSVPPYRSRLPSKHCLVCDGHVREMQSLLYFCKHNASRQYLRHNANSHTSLHTNPMHSCCSHALDAQQTELMDHHWQTPGPDDCLHLHVTWLHNSIVIEANVCMHLADVTPQSGKTPH